MAHNANDIPVVLAYTISINKITILFFNQ